MKRIIAKKYIEKASLLSKDEAEHFYARMGRKITRSLEHRKLLPLEALALQLEVEDDNLKEWRENIMQINRCTK